MPLTLCFRGLQVVVRAPFRGARGLSNLPCLWWVHLHSEAWEAWEDKSSKVPRRAAYKKKQWGEMGGGHTSINGVWSVNLEGKSENKAMAQPRRQRGPLPARKALPTHLPIGWLFMMKQHSLNPHSRRDPQNAALGSGLHTSGDFTFPHVSVTTGASWLVAFCKAKAQVQLLEEICLQWTGIAGSPRDQPSCIVWAHNSMQTGA